MEIIKFKAQEWIYRPNYYYLNKDNIVGVYQEPGANYSIIVTIGREFFVEGNLEENLSKLGFEE